MVILGPPFEETTMLPISYASVPGNQANSLTSPMLGKLSVKALDAFDASFKTIQHAFMFH